MRKRDYFRLAFLITGMCYILWINNAQSQELTAVRDNIYDVLSVNMTESECMVYNTYMESRSESDFSNLIVMASVANRVRSDRWGDTYCDVVLQPSQYSWVRDGLSDYPHEKGQFYRMEDLYKFFEENKEAILVMSEGCDMYHHEDIKPKWDWSKLDYIGQFDQHLCYKHK